MLVRLLRDSVLPRCADKYILWEQQFKKQYYTTIKKGKRLPLATAIILQFETVNIGNYILRPAFKSNLKSVVGIPSGKATEPSS